MQRLEWNLEIARHELPRCISPGSIPDRSPLWPHTEMSNRLGLFRRLIGATRRLQLVRAPTTPDLAPRTASRCLATAALTNATATGRSSHAPALASDRGSPRALRGCPYPPPEMGTARPSLPPRRSPAPTSFKTDESLYVTRSKPTAPTIVPCTTVVHTPRSHRCRASCEVVRDWFSHAFREDGQAYRMPTTSDDRQNHREDDAITERTARSPNPRLSSAPRTTTARNWQRRQCARRGSRFRRSASQTNTTAQKNITTT